MFYFVLRCVPLFYVVFHCFAIFCYSLVVLLDHVRTLFLSGHGFEVDAYISWSTPLKKLGAAWAIVANVLSCPQINISFHYI